MKSDKKHIILRAIHEARAMGDGTCQPSLNERIAKEIGLENYLNALGFYAVQSEGKDIILADKYKVMKHTHHSHRIYLDIHTGKYYSLNKVKLWLNTKEDHIQTSFKA